MIDLSPQPARFLSGFGQIGRQLFEERDLGFNQVPRLVEVGGLVQFESVAQYPGSPGSFRPIGGSTGSGTAIGYAKWSGSRSSDVHLPEKHELYRLATHAGDGQPEPRSPT